MSTGGFEQAEWSPCSIKGDPGEEEKPDVSQIQIARNQLHWPGNMHGDKSAEIRSRLEHKVAP